MLYFCVSEIDFAAQVDLVLVAAEIAKFISISVLSKNELLQP